MSERSRGRPKGSSPNKEQDELVLRQAALRLLARQVSTPTEAFRELVGFADEARIRRLQRRWSADGQSFIEELQASWRRERWAREAQSLEKAAPTLFAQVRSFAASDGGQKTLADLGVGTDNASLMSLGIMKIGELLQAYRPVGKNAAEYAFAECMARWSRYGVNPDAEFLNRFAELCKANETSAEEGAGDGRPEDNTEGSDGGAL